MREVPDASRRLTDRVPWGRLEILRERDSTEKPDETMPGCRSTPRSRVAGGHAPHRTAGRARNHRVRDGPLWALLLTSCFTGQVPEIRTAYLSGTLGQVGPLLAPREFSGLPAEDRSLLTSVSR